MTMRARALRPVSTRACALAFRRAEREKIVVVEGQAVRAEFGQPFDGLDDVQCGPGRHAERIVRRPANGPQTERELVGRLGGDIASRRNSGLEDRHVALLTKTRWIC